MISMYSITNIQENLEAFDDNFIKLLTNDKLNINLIEELLIQNIDEYKQFMNNHVEELMINKINEEKLISKKNNIGTKKDSN